jgi:ribosomal protein S18 acetylase RimI-like enzyme
MAEIRVRGMKPADIADAAAVSAGAFGLDISSPLAAAHFEERLMHLLRSDPEGAFVAERGRRIVGLAQAMVRERLWCLSLLAVAPEQQSDGAGRALMARALGYGADAEAGLIVGSNDPRALRLYARAGFTLHPTFEAVGPLDRSALPGPDREVRDGGAGDLEAIGAISREIRGAPHTPELELMLRQGARLLRLGDRGFAVAQPPHGVWLLVARDDAAARSLLWTALALAGDAARPAIRWVTGAQDWAISVAVEAGLRLTATGALCVRGRPGPLRPFVPSGPFA